MSSPLLYIKCEIKSTSKKSCDRFKVRNKEESFLKPKNKNINTKKERSIRKENISLKRSTTINNHNSLKRKVSSLS